VLCAVFGAAVRALGLSGAMPRTPLALDRSCGPAEVGRTRRGGAALPVGEIHSVVTGIG
jgi:hypothetical protein